MLLNLINTIIKSDNNKHMLWPEMIRLLILHSDERQDLDKETLDPHIQELLRKLGSLSPSEYTWKMNYREKVDILLFLVDLIHDLDKFRQFLNKRLEEKSTLFK